MDSDLLFKRAEQILIAVREFATDDSDVAWTTWETPAEMRAEIDNCIEKIRRQDPDGVRKGAILFLPTSDFQEHSISNGWSEEYLQLSSSFDQVDESLRGCC